MRTYRRYNIRLRFEPDEPVPGEGDTYEAETAIAGDPVHVKVLKIKRVFEHPNEPGVTLMDAYISRSACRCTR